MNSKNTNRKDAIIATIKEALRIAVFTAIGALVEWGYTQVAQLPADGALTMILTLALRLVDKFIHKNENTDKNGLLPF